MAIKISISATQNSQNISNNTSNVTAIVKYTWSGGSYNHNGATLEINIGGKKEQFTVKLNPNNTYNGTAELGRFTTNVTHNADGTKTVNFSAWLSPAPNQGQTVEASGSLVLTRIPKAAILTSAENFTDEGNLKVTYDNPAGNGVDEIGVGIWLEDKNIDIYREVSKTGSSYTFQLTEAERNTLRNAMTNSNSRTVEVYLCTEIGDDEYFSSLMKTFTIVNADPVINPTITDVNPTTATLTGSSNKLVRYFSDTKIAFGASALKGASIVSKKVTCGSATLTADGTINDIESGSFKFTVTDSRGNTTTKTVSKDIVNYVKLTSNFSNVNFSTDGEITFNIKGNYFDNSFGATSNVLIVQYRIKEENDVFSDWIETEPIIENNSYTCPVALYGLDYRTNYIVELKAIDELTVIETDRLFTCVPVFGWSKTDFAFHVPVYMDNARQIYSKSTEDEDFIMVSLNNQNQAFYGYGGYSAEKGTTYFDGNAVNIRSKNNINNSASGTIGGNKAWTNSSDSRLKTNIEDIPAVFADIWMELQPKVFEWNELNNGDNKKHFGLIAQDAISVFKKYGIDYNSLGFIEIIPINNIEYFAITYEDYNMLTAKVLKNTVSRLAIVESKLKELMEVQ